MIPLQPFNESCADQVNGQIHPGLLLCVSDQEGHLWDHLLGFNCPSRELFRGFFGNQQSGMQQPDHRCCPTDILQQRGWKGCVSGAAAKTGALVLCLVIEDAIRGILTCLSFVVYKCQPKTTHKTCKCHGLHAGMGLGIEGRSVFELKPRKKNNTTPTAIASNI